MRLSEIVSKPDMLMSADREEIPITVYHGTSLAIYEQYISKMGLSPMPLPDEKKAYVFLSWSEAGASKFAPGGVWQRSEGVGVILEVTLTPEIAKKIRSKIGEFLRCPVNIPASQIKVISYTNK